MKLLAIDPGFAKGGSGCACAAFVDGRLDVVWFERPGQPPRGLVIDDEFDRVVIEQPQQDTRSRGIPPADLIRLAWDGALLGGLYAGATDAEVVARTPSDWKGSEPKPVQHVRLWRVLSEAERDVLGGDPVARAIFTARERGALERWKRPGAAYYPASWGTHNLLDAAALGCVELGRLTR